MASNGIYNVTAQDVANARNSISMAINDRLIWELEHNSVPTDLASITSYLHNFSRKINDARHYDHYSLGFFAKNPLDFEAVFTSHRRSTACYNIYAIPKAMAVGRCLNGSTLSETTPDDETIAGVVLAMARGVTLQKQLANAVNDHMNRDGRGRGSYASGGTQASSALRALEALGVVQNTGGNHWGAADPLRFQRLVDAANGVRWQGEEESVTESELADAFVTIEGECETVHPAPALAAPLLALPAPAPVKSKRARKSK